MVPWPDVPKNFWQERTCKELGKKKIYRKLNESDVKEIKILLNFSKMTQVEIAKKYNVSRFLINKIKHKKRYEYIEN